MDRIDKIRSDLKLAIKNESFVQLKFVAELADELLGELKTVVTERDAAVAEVKEILTVVEKLRLAAEPNISSELDDGLGFLCIKHCAKSGKHCYKEGASPEICLNWKWRGVSVPDAKISQFMNL